MMGYNGEKPCLFDCDMLVLQPAFEYEVDWFFRWSTGFYIFANFQ